MEPETKVGGKWAGVRLDAALVATLVVGVALVVGSVVLVSMVRSQLTGAVETRVVTRAQDLTQLVDTNSLPDQIPSVRGISAQIVGNNGEVVASTNDIEGQVPINDTRPDPGQIVLVHQPSFNQNQGQNERHEEGENAGGENEDEGPFLIAVSGPTKANGPHVIVAASLTSVESAVGTLRTLLIGGIPIVALVVFATTWFLAGRTLKPVKAMTNEAEQITVTDLQRRIPLPRSADEVRELGETLNHMLARLEGSVLRQRRFVADASHELKSPVAALLTMSEVATLNPERIDKLRLAHDVEIESRRMSLLVDDLLTMARADEGAFSLVKSEFDLGLLITEETAHLAPGDVSIDLNGLSPVKMFADRRRIAQVARNLVDNAVTHATNRVWVETKQTPAGTELLVADDGSGISPQDRQRVFERFVRLDESRSRTDGGTGLGLAVAKTLVEAHGGTIGVEDDSRHPGATIVVRLPIGNRDVG